MIHEIRPYILCADDEKAVLDTLSTQLEESVLRDGFEFEYAESGEEILEIIDDLTIHKEEIAVVISDQLMPRMKGHELLIQVHKQLPDSQKILLTGQAGMDSVVSAINNASLYRYLAKPWDKTDLLLTVEEAGKLFVTKRINEEQNRMLEHLYAASEVMSVENRLENLAPRVMEQIITDAGATRGCLMLTGAERLMRAYCYDARPGAEGGPCRIEPDSRAHLPYALIDHVLTKRKRFVIDDLANERLPEALQHDPYFIAHRPKSVFCKPLLHNKEIVGLLYLEHKTAPHVFDKHCQAFIRHLAPNLATALDNALLYDNLEVKNQKVLEQKNLIEEKITEISHSIRATKRIQKALAPPRKLLARHFADSAIFFSPKEEVSGDFYWMRRVHNIFLVAAADCTGHGVPGAMLSVLGANLLERIVMESGETSPERVLARLDELTTKMLQQDKTERALDGMDIGLCAIDMTTRQVRYAGAHRPLYRIRGGEIEEYKGDRRAIGGNPDLKNEPFQLHEVDALPGDQLLIFTDGLTDQFGGYGVDRKFGAKKLRQVVADHSEAPTVELMNKIEAALRGWQGNADQTDDVLAIGFAL